MEKIGRQVIMQQRLEAQRQLRKDIDEVFRSDFVYLLKAANIFALMSYDLLYKTNTVIKEYNEKYDKNVNLLQKFKSDAKNMNKHRELMQHYALAMTKELATVLGEYSGKGKPMELYWCICETFERFTELLGVILSSSNEDADKLERLWETLQTFAKEKIAEVEKPDFKALRELSNELLSSIDNAKEDRK